MVISKRGFRYAKKGKPLVRKTHCIFFFKYCVSFWHRGQIYFLTRVINCLPLEQSLGRCSGSTFKNKEEMMFLKLQGSSAKIQTHCVCSIPLSHLALPLWGLRASRTHENMKLMPPSVLWTITSFIFDPGASCLAPVSVKQWQANLLACR